MSKLGAIVYILWGLLHIFAAFKIYKLGMAQKSGIVQGRIYQNAWNLLCIALAVIIIAIAYNWNNSVYSYWLNLAITSITDTGFIFFIIVPHYIPTKLAIQGPLLWIAAITLSTMGII